MFSTTRRGNIMPWRSCGPMRRGSIGSVTTKADRAFRRALTVWRRCGRAGHRAVGSMNVLALLQAKLQDALTGLVTDPAVYAAMLKPAQDARFGDYQANCAMPLGKKLGKPPREMAQTIVERLQQQSIPATTEIAGPGFINLKLD